MKNVTESNFEEYSESLNESLTNESKEKISISCIQGIEIIAIFWIVGMSIVGTPILIFYLGYKGYSLGYTISAILRLIGLADGNKYIFQNLFLRNVFLVFIMIFLANYSIKISRNFFEKKANIKIGAIKYTLISTFMTVLWIIGYLLEKAL